MVLAKGHTVAARKRWIGYTAQPRGQLVLDAGARRAVQCEGRSLLAIGILKAIGRFHKGDIVSLCDGEGGEFARGLTNYASDDVLRIRGLRTNEIAETLGHCPHDEVVHRNNMVITGEATD